jgi:hypothetical protein
VSDRVLSAVQAAPSGEVAGGLAIYLFGPMEVCIGSSPLPRLRALQAGWLFALVFGAVGAI